MAVSMDKRWGLCAFYRHPYTTQALMPAHAGIYMEQIMNAELALCQGPGSAGLEVLSPVGE